MARLPLLLLLVFASCSRRTAPANVPEDEARHRAALTQLTVFNHTDQRLTIAFRSATPPPQEVVLGGIDAGVREKLAPIPAGEPIIMVARKPDGSELVLTPRSYPADGEFTWDIPQSAVFRSS